MAIGSIFDKNVFNQESFNKIYNKEDGPYRIVITPTDTRASGFKDFTINGVLNEEMSFNFKAEYDTFGFGGLISNSKWLETAYKTVMMPLRYGGRNIDNIGLVTQKFYIRSGYLNINPNFRVVDWAGDNKPVNTAKGLAALCLPQYETNLGDISQAIKESENEIVAGGGKLIFGLAEEGIEAAGKIGDWTLSHVPNVPNNAGSQATNKFKEDIYKSLSLTSSPPTVEVTIGNWFYKSDMIIEDVNIKFSKEMTKVGPLYVDISLQMSSKEALYIDGDGFQFKGKRVTTAGKDNRISMNTNTSSDIGMD